MEPEPTSAEPSECDTIEELFAALESPLLAYALRLTGDAGVAEDMVQEAFMKLHAQFDEVREPRRWLYRTVHNLALNYRRGGIEINYSQQDAKDIIDRNTADENAAFMKLAERLIQQQDAAVSNPTAPKASIPDQGRVLTFRRSVVVDAWADLRIRLAASAVQAASWAARVLILAATMFALAGTAIAARVFRN